MEEVKAGEAESLESQGAGMENHTSRLNADRYTKPMEAFWSRSAGK
jgi:hypothetical protein